jgi:hypothetical protein
MGLSQGEETRPGASPILAWLLPIALTAIAIILLATGDSGRELLRYDRAALAGGEAWRLLSGHLVHLGRQRGQFSVPDYDWWSKYMRHGDRIMIYGW